MKFFSFILLGAFTSLASADGGYANYCRNATLVKVGNEAGLRAYCATASGDTQCSILSLDKCYGSDVGRMKPKDNGNLSKRCPFNFSELDGTTLKSRCYRTPLKKGSLVWTSADTNVLVAADDGVLKCFNHRATTPPNCKERPVLSGTEPIGMPMSFVYCLYLLFFAFFMW
ncbi:uncharacterized protein GGS22DRAFT_187053 [Annulohypoxylon maeteangense]|uniref:uncharacterized protein n=1 Tax=Annulohypoxylon maeteangense TaxID=1927788 RepID=UPI002008A44F|nr:uncharacterized protein GGS22DRAFT_187053 [Annulohypoxylon maeteangense]KAI0886973.1 hypothetical protein GGS22DRAFT_187053 [Annulohypoxylon maeteangense]